ncbi:MAG: hypothetical protein R3B67_07055 [Phycisphaerales bacterium]
MVDRCTSNVNKLDGITVYSFGVITNNSVSGNGGFSVGGAGIRIEPGASRTLIRGNNCSQNNWGVRVEGSLNLLIGNTCTNNTTNFDIVSGNRVGEIVVLSTSGAISGNSGGSTTPTNPASNFAF